MADDAQQRSAGGGNQWVTTVTQQSRALQVTVTFRTPNWSPAFNTQNCGYNPSDVGSCQAGAPQNWGYDRQRWIWLAAYNGSSWWGSYLVGSVLIQNDAAAPIISG